MHPDWNQHVIIGNKAFADCKQLMYFEFEGEGPESLQIADDAFDGCNNDLIFICGFYGDVGTEVKEYALDHGFQYIENEKYGGDG